MRVHDADSVFAALLEEDGLPSDLAYSELLVPSSVLQLKRSLRVSCSSWFSMPILDLHWTNPCACEHDQ